MGASGKVRRPAGPWAPPDAVHGAAQSCRPPPARVCAGPPLPARRRPIGAGRARPTRQRGRARAPPPHWPAPGTLAPPGLRRGGDARGAGAGRPSAGEEAQDPRPPDAGRMQTPARLRQRRTERRGPGRPAVPPRSSLTWPVPPARVHPPAQPAFLGRGAVAERRQLRAEQQRVRRLPAAAVAQRLARGVEAVLQQPAEQ